MDPNQIAELVDGLENDVKNIKTESLKLAWYMRGGLSYTESMGLSTEERSIISDIIKENLEFTLRISTTVPYLSWIQALLYSKMMALGEPRQ